MDACLQILANTADMIKNFAVIYLVDISEVPDFNTMYEVSLDLQGQGARRLLAISCMSTTFERLH